MGDYAGQGYPGALPVLAVLHLQGTVVHGESAVVEHGRARRNGDEELCPGEEEAQVAVVEVVLPQGDRAAVVADAHGVHKAHALQGQPPAAAAAAVHAATPTAMVPPCYEVELGATTAAIGSLAVGCPRRFVQMEGTELLAPHCDNTQATFGLDQFLVHGCHVALGCKQTTHF